MPATSCTLMVSSHVLVFGSEESQQHKCYAENLMKTHLVRILFVNKCIYSTNKMEMNKYSPTEEQPLIVFSIVNALLLCSGCFKQMIVKKC